MVPQRENAVLGPVQCDIGFLFWKPAVGKCRGTTHAAGEKTNSWCSAGGQALAGWRTGCSPQAYAWAGGCQGPNLSSLVHVLEAAASCQAGKCPHPLDIMKSLHHMSVSQAVLMSFSFPSNLKVRGNEEEVSAAIPVCISSSRSKVVLFMVCVEMCGKIFSFKLYIDSF